MVSHHKIFMDAAHARLVEACTTGDVGVVRMLLAGGRVRATAMCAEEACRHGHAEVLVVLLADGTLNPAANNNKLLRDACEWGCADSVRVLVADTRVQTTMPMYKTLTWTTNPEVLVELLACGVGIPEDTDDMTAIESACSRRDWACLEVLLRDGRVHPGNALYSACEAGHAPVVQLALADARTRVSESVLAAAVRSGSVDVIRLLLADGRPFIMDKIMAVACAGGNVDIIRLLLENDRVHVTETALVAACRTGNVSVARLALGRVAVTEPALIAASTNGSVDVVRLLLVEGRAHPTPAALQHATWSGHRQVARLLLTVVDFAPGRTIRGTWVHKVHLRRKRTSAWMNTV